MIELVPYFAIGVVVAAVAVVIYDTRKEKKRRWGENYE